MRTLLLAVTILSIGACGGGGSKPTVDTADTIAPTATVVANKATVGSSQVVTYSVTFSEAITGFEMSDITTTGGTPSALTESGGTFTLAVTADNYASSADVTISIPAGAYVDAAGNINTVGSTKNIPIVPTWTIFVYGHADHSLSNVLVSDILEMAAATTGENVRILVIADWDASAQAAIGASHVINEGDTYPTGAHWYRVDDGNANGADSVEYAGEFTLSEDLDNPAVLSATTQLAFQAFPSDRRAIILFDHGGGWADGYGHDSGNGTNPDNYSMSVESAIAAVDAGLDAAGVTQNRPLDLLAFSTCLLTAVEVADAAENTADVFIGNADLGWAASKVHGVFDYTGFFNAVTNTPSADSAVIAKAEVGAFDVRRNTSPIFMSRQVRAHSAIDLRLWNNFSTAMDTLRQLLVTADSATLSSVFLNATPGYGISDGRDHNRVPVGDAGTLLTGLLNLGGGIGTQASLARTALQNAVIENSLGVIRAGAGNQLGIGIEIPISKDWLAPNKVLNPLTQTWQSRRTGYASLATQWNTHTAWHTAIDQAAVGDDNAGFTITGSITNGVNPTNVNKPVYAFYAPEQDMAFGNISLFLNYPVSGVGTVYVSCGIVADQPLTPLAVGTEYQYAWDGKAWTVTDGVSTTLAQLRVYTTGAFYAIEGEFAAGTDTFSGDILIDANTSAISGVIVEIPAIQGFPIADLPSGTTFTPSLTYLSGGNKVVVSSGAVLHITNGNFSIQHVDVDHSEFELLLRLDDAWGNSSIDVQAVSVGAPFADN